MMEMAGPPPMMEIKLIRKINLSNDGNRRTPPQDGLFHHFLFEGTPYWVHKYMYISLRARYDNHRQHYSV